MEFGFRLNHSNETATYYFMEEIKAMMDKGGTVGAVFLDVTKAFDTTNHRVLLCKFSAITSSGGAVKLVESYLSNQYLTV